MSMTVLIVGEGKKKQFLFNESNKYERCKDCEFLSELGNCMKVGGFYSSVLDKYCPKLQINI